MEKTVYDQELTNEDIHKLCEYNYEMTKDMSHEERLDYYNKRGNEVQLKLEKMQASEKNADSPCFRLLTPARCQTQEEKG